MGVVCCFSQIEAGTAECFYEDVKPENSLRVEFEVLRGGEQDIEFVLKTPDSQVAFTKKAKFNHPYVVVHLYAA